MRNAIDVRLGNERITDLAFFGVSLLLFAVGATLMIHWCTAMPGMGEMSMPGGWTMSMAWMLMPGQTWPDVAASFLGMWAAMMMAMMLPSLVPMLWRYRRTVGNSGGGHLGRLTLLAGAGYFIVWMLLGLAALPLGVALAELAMRQPVWSRAVPVAVGVAVTMSGALQFTAWKSRYLSCCRQSPFEVCSIPGAGAAWSHGLRLGRQCCACCANLMLIPLIVGVMDLRAMTAVTAAITVERLVPAGERVARAVGAVIAATGLLLIVRAHGLD